ISPVGLLSLVLSLWLVFVYMRHFHNNNARTTVKAKFRELIQNAGAKPAQDLIKLINGVLSGWVIYFRVGISSLGFSEVR
ncbi:group II intron maturase-specific domain-containing protein, partial [Bacillus cereus]|uniref:group II intron maturase-specific domain-containing protein n=1 Tax=Bacillus cereus TaxID=1396 RepID=UPI0024141283